MTPDTRGSIVEVAIALAMERSLTKVSFSGFEHGCDSVGLEGSGEEEDDLDSSEETRKMVVKRNRKGKKSGGFQSMGMYLMCFCQLWYVTIAPRLATISYC